MATTLGSNSGFRSTPAISNATDKAIPPMWSTTARLNACGIDEESAILIYETRSKENLPKSLSNYGTCPVWIYKTRFGFNPGK
jgi:hypothetical protein